jgi:flagellar hook protein FlgE
MGWEADATGTIDTTVPPTTITVPLGQGMTGKASSSLTVSGNLDATTTAAASAVTPTTLSTTVYDAQGNAVPITLSFTKTANNAWTVVPTTPASSTVPPTATVSGTTSITFNGEGKIATGGTGTLQLTLNMGATTPQSISLDLSGLTQLAASADLNSNTDGASAGSLTSFSVGQAGDITGIYSNGYKQSLGQIALASFANPSGLMKAGGNLFTASANSGTASVGTPDTGGRGTIATGFLEGSNVDLAQQFTNMIMAERGFQANSRVISTSDEILQDLVNLKH